MNNTINRRAFLGTTIAAFAAAPWVIRHFRKTNPLPESAWIDKVPSKMSSSGYLSVAEVSFSPLTLPNSNDLQILSIAACLSTDKDLVLVSYSYGDDWKSRLCCAPLSKKGVIGNFDTLLDIEKSWSIITGIGCSGIKSGNVSFVIRRCEPDDDQARCKEFLFFANISGSRQGGYSLSINETDYGHPTHNHLMVMKSRFNTFVDSNPHCWANGTASLFFGGRWGVDKYSPEEGKKPSAYTRKVITDFSGSNLRSGTPQDTICSGIYDNDDGTLSFVTSPWSFTASPYSEKEAENYLTRGVQGSVELGLVTGDGNKIVIDLEGNVLSQAPFPAIPYSQLAMLTKTHWCFAHHRGAPFLYSAPLDDPKNYTVFTLLMDQSTISTTEVPLTFKIHAVLPGGQSLLCSRNVGTSYVAEAKRAGIPLCELGIVKLPLLPFDFAS